MVKMQTINGFTEGATPIVQMPPTHVKGGNITIVMDEYEHIRGI